ncbi:hypothetical protein Cgig2_033724 [Carnegiea gigantea]|uniref:Myb/SANT-like domain-containing protein n=1 Tax=Carnegiea gigantea TaxID=171969 RepID=A0A9Q1GJB3_9CARY|nr:hypothetical protein Cgig2_033724 [Carnegiea gigantea]
MAQSQNSQGGSRMDVSQSSQIGKGRNKRFWTKEEEWALVHGLLELSADPQWKTEGNFKGGYLVKLEKMMTAKCPGSGLKAYPHIDSKTKWFRDKYNVLMEMFRTSGFTWDDTTKMIKCERQCYDDFCKNHKHAKGLWGVPFPFLDELGKIFGADRATGASYEDYVEAVDNLHNDNETIDLDKDGEDEEEEEDESVHSAQPSPQLSKRARREKTSMGKGKKRMSEVIDLTSTFTNVSSNISGFMSGMNSHLETIASAFTTTQQHEQVIMARELHLDQKQKELDEKKKGLFNEVMKIPGLTRVEAMMAAKKLVSDESGLTIFYECPDDEWKKDFILNLIHPDLPPFN